VVIHYEEVLYQVYGPLPLYSEYNTEDDEHRQTGYPNLSWVVCAKCKHNFTQTLSVAEHEAQNHFCGLRTECFLARTSRLTCRQLFITTRCHDMLQTILTRTLSSTTNKRSFLKNANCENLIIISHFVSGINIKDGKHDILIFAYKRYLIFGYAKKK